MTLFHSHHSPHKRPTHFQKKNKDHHHQVNIDNNFSPQLHNNKNKSPTLIQGKQGLAPTPSKKYSLNDS